MQPSEAGATDRQHAGGLAPPGIGAAAAWAPGSGRPSVEHRASNVSTTDRPSTPGVSTGSGTTAYEATSSGTSRKTPVPPALRPVNVIQHDDAGAASDAGAVEGEPETVELPPAYTNIKKPA